MNEHDWISLLRSRVGVTTGIVGVGDDAAVLPGGLLATTDTFVEGIHFRPEWAPWERIGRKMAEASISDIAAMGGTPLWMLANLSSSAGEEAARGLLEGILASGVPLVGGDTTSAPRGALTVSLTVLGRADRPVYRIGARPGDSLYISGPVGGAQGGLVSLEQKLGIASLENRFLDPRARVDLGKVWAKTATAMIDISDGLSSELHHLARESHMRLWINPSAIPLHPDLASVTDDPLGMALGSGDEYELLAASPSPLPQGILIGVVEEGEGVFARERELPLKGYSHQI